MEKCYTLFFDEIDQKDISLVGGKGANLVEMTRAGFPVPYGFCVTTKSFKEFIGVNNLDQYIADVIRDARLDNIRIIGATIREKLKKALIPESVKEAIVQAVPKTGADSYYAVRSSATAEDLAFASFAGQQDTYLNIKGEAALLEAVRDCWASLFTDRAILYRIQNNIAHEKVQMSVVVQKMALAEVSGIMFTANPVSGHRGMITIDAGYGLGEALVSGLVSADVYKFNKTTGQIVSKTIAEKKLAILPLAEGGTEKVELTGERASSQVLDDFLIQNLAELGMKIEKHYGCPQDIEWCMSRDSFSSSSGTPTVIIVQSRAVTSLFPLPAPIPKDDDLHAYISFSHIQVMTDPISHLGQDMLKIIASLGKGPHSPAIDNYAKTAAGRIYFDASELLANRTTRKILIKILENFDALTSLALVELINRSDFDTRIKKNKNTAKALWGFLKPVAVKAFKTLIFKKVEGEVNFADDYIKKRVRKAEEEIRRAQPGIEKLEAICRTAPYLPDFQVLIPNLLTGVISFKALEALEQKLLGSHKYTDLIIKGLEGNITTEMGLLVGDLADQVRNSPDLTGEFTSSDYSTLFTRINNLPGHEEFKKDFNAFMAKYDMRAAGEVDMAKERWIENPELLAKSILAIVNTAREGTHRNEYKATIARANEAAETLSKEIEARHGKLKAGVVRRLIRVLRNCLPLREHNKYLIMKLILISKIAFLDVAKLLVKKGQLAEEKDIFYLGFEEIYTAVQENTDLMELVTQRKEEYQHYEKLTPPRLLTSDGEEIKAGYDKKNLPENALVGMPVSSGVIEGIAKVITDPSGASLDKGEILVAPFTDPGWTPLFINAAGLVMEVGGLLTHGTVVAREYGIPAVVGIIDATKQIKNGQKIRVDGDAGFVLVIEE